MYEKSLASVGFGMIMLIIADFITMIMKNRWKCMIHITIFRGDMETVEPMWWRSHYKTETEKITDHWWFYEVWAKPSQQVRM